MGVSLMDLAEGDSVVGVARSADLSDDEVEGEATAVQEQDSAQPAGADGDTSPGDEHGSGEGPVTQDSGPVSEDQ
jgi:hypothetical protein